MDLHGYTIGVCSWSLHPEGSADLVRQVKALKLDAVQIAIGSLLALDEPDRQRELKILLGSGLRFTGGMIGFAGENYSTIADIRRTGGIVPDADWPVRKERLQQTVTVARQLPISAITTHLGFIPPKVDARFPVIVQRVREAAAILSSANLRLLMETGQESAAELAAFLEALDAPQVGINFDPANMILYGAGDPIAAVGTLGKWIGHVHVKDAVASSQPGKEWGAEVPFGSGQVGAAAFLRALKSVGYKGALSIEREAGSTRAADIAAAIAALRDA
jgi:sugar phosphate isomerase/epimerase